MIDKRLFSYLSGYSINITSSSRCVSSKFSGHDIVKLQAPEAQQTQGIDSVSQSISTASFSFHLNLRDNSKYKVNTLRPLCLWQCLHVTGLRHLHLLQIWAPGDFTLASICISCKFAHHGRKFSHQVAPRALIINLATRWRHLSHCHIALDCPIDIGFLHLFCKSRIYMATRP